MKKTNPLKTKVYDEIDLLSEVKKRKEEESVWYFFLLDLQKTILTLDNFNFEISVKKKLVKF